MSRWLIIAGIALVILGLLVHLAPWLFQWFGKLPGDINIRSDKSQVFIPITSMILISILLTIVLNLFNR